MAAAEGLVEGKALHYGMIPEEWITRTPVSGAAGTRTNRLILTALESMPEAHEAVRQYGADRVAVVLGSSTSGIEETLAGFERLGTQQPLPEDFPIVRMNVSEPALFAARQIGAAGPAYCIGNVYAAGAMAVISAAKLLQAGLADAVLTGAIDGFSRFTTLGFMGLGALSESPCKPFSSERAGINLGEGGALMLLTRSPSPLRLKGWGTSSDAHHISAPDPAGAGAAAAMRAALECARMQPDELDLILPHGTATRHNDEMEARAIHQVFGSRTPAAALKQLSGHTLAGAGALQCAIAAALLTGNPEGRLPAAFPPGPADDSLAPARILRAPESLGRPIRSILANAFAFGGSNVSLILCSEGGA